MSTFPVRLIVRIKSHTNLCKNLDLETSKDLEIQQLQSQLLERDNTILSLKSQISKKEQCVVDIEAEINEVTEELDNEKRRAGETDQLLKKYFVHSISHYLPAYLQGENAALQGQVRNLHMSSDHVWGGDIANRLRRDLSIQNTGH